MSREEDDSIYMPLSNLLLQTDAEYAPLSIVLCGIVSNRFNPKMPLSNEGV